MKKIEIEELKQIQLKILNVVTSFCEEHDINYWLNCGTLLGAIRHKGYIPWDDDIDLGMLRSDYDKFMKLFNEKNERYKAYSIENNPQFLYPFIKVLDTSTVLYEPDEKGFKSSVNIDIFVYDNAPDDDKKVKKMYQKRDYYRALNNIRGRLFYSKDRPLLHIVKKCLYPFLLIFPPPYFCKKMIKNSKKFEKEQTKRIGNFTAVTKLVCDKELFSEFIYVEFENKLYKAPREYDIWLKLFYGDYMQLPPKEKQVAHHSFIAYNIEEENDNEEI